MKPTKSNTVTNPAPTTNASAPAGTDTPPAPKSTETAAPTSTTTTPPAAPPIERPTVEALAAALPSVPSIIIDSLTDADAAHIISIADTNDRAAALASIVGEHLRRMGKARGDVLALRLAIVAIGQMAADAMKSARATVTAEDRKAGALHVHRTTQRRALASMPEAMPAVIGALDYIVAAGAVIKGKRARMMNVQNGRTAGDVLDAITATAPKGAAQIDDVCN